MRRVIWSPRGRKFFDCDVVGYLLDKGEAGQRALDDVDGGEDLVILRIVHTARDWPAGRWPR